MVVVVHIVLQVIARERAVVSASIEHRITASGENILYRIN